jgi:hypothetical protein
MSATKTPAILPAPRVIWRACADVIPDEDTLVLIALNDGSVITAIRLGDRWMAESFRIHSDLVMAWAEMPEHPFADEIDLAWQLATPDETVAEIDDQEGGAA